MMAEDEGIDLLAGSPYMSYAYSYPHKTAYRPLAGPTPLSDVWAQERRDAVFLYLHVPFCEMRCGFCNLFTIAGPEQSMEQQYLAALRREAETVRESIGPVSVARMAIGGGTPTYLEEAELASLFDVARRTFGVARDVPVSVETSPATATPERLAVLAENGVDRISIGVQSFLENETAAIGRGQKRNVVERALGNIRDRGVETLNIDLMYGLPHQTVETWMASLDAALQFHPEELYLYPLYVRPLTGLGKTRRQWDDTRLQYYRTGRDRLRDAGYEQVSMRMFRLKQPSPDHSGDPRNPEMSVGGSLATGDRHLLTGPVYCCQDDGMIGIGCGARSYTQALHYSTEFAVGRTGVKAILKDYIERPAGDFRRASYGVRLDRWEQARRYVINSLLQAEGMDLAAYGRRFGTVAMDDFPRLAELFEVGLARPELNRIVLTDNGMERADAIGPWLYSEPMRRLMSEFDLR